MSKTMQELKQAIEDRDEVIEKLLADIAERDRAIAELRDRPYTPQIVGDFTNLAPATRITITNTTKEVDWSFLEKK